MKVQLSRDEKLELQMISGDIKHKQGYLKALKTLDSSNMEHIAQFNHKLLQLLESVKGNQYRQDIHTLAETHQNRFMVVADSFEIDDTFLPILASGIKDEMNKIHDIINYYKNPNCDEAKYSTTEKINTYITNYTNRYNALDSALSKLLSI